MPFKEGDIRVLALGIITKNGKVLACPGYDAVRNLKFYRIIGGGVEFGEPSELAVKREFKEELGYDIYITRQLGCIENIFEFHGKKGHEILFVYAAEFSDKTLYNKKEFTLDDDNKHVKAVWVDYTKNTVFPEGIAKYL